MQQSMNIGVTEGKDLAPRDYMCHKKVAGLIEVWYEYNVNVPVP